MGTLAFMTEFYRQLQEAPTRADALRRTQLAMLQGDIQLQSTQLVTTEGVAIPLPSELQDSSIDLT